MPDGRVYQTELGWVAADNAGWTDEVYPTEAAARAAVVLTKAPKIRSEVWYNDDDGIWVICLADGQLHWEVNLGLNPSVNTLMTWWAGHIAREHSDGSDDADKG